MRPERVTRPASRRLRSAGSSTSMATSAAAFPSRCIHSSEFAPAHGAEKGLSEAGQTIVLPLLVAREFHAFTFVFNGELEKPLHDPSRELASGFGFAFGRSFTRKV